MAIVADLYQEWNGDFVLTANGDIQLAQGWDLTRQNIERFILTNPETVHDNRPVPSDDLFNPTLGLGARVDIGSTYNNKTVEKIKQQLYEGILASPNVDQQNPPAIVAKVINPTTVHFTAFVNLINGQQQTIQLSLP